MSVLTSEMKEAIALEIQREMEKLRFQQISDPASNDRIVESRLEKLESDFALLCKNQAKQEEEIEEYYDEPVPEVLVRRGTEEEGPGWMVVVGGYYVDVHSRKETADYVAENLRDALKSLWPSWDQEAFHTEKTKRLEEKLRAADECARQAGQHTQDTLEGYRKRAEAAEAEAKALREHLKGSHTIYTCDWCRKHFEEKPENV